MRLLSRALLAVLVVVAVVAMWWLDWLREPDPGREAEAGPRHEPSHYFEGFRLAAHDGPGGPTYVLDGERLVRYADDGTAEVAEPRLRHRGTAGGPPWHARGRRGEVGPDGDRVDLEGEVMLRREPGDRAGLVVETSRMTVFTDAGRAQTDRAVTAHRPGLRIDAVGMTALFREDRIRLHAEVRGRHEPALADDG
jgi:LPS export ABC transporter protein LptC